MLRWLTILALAVSCVWPAAARAQAAQRVQATVTTHGLRITLRVARRTYPLNAVIAATLILRNSSKHRVSVESGLDAPRVLVQGGQGFDPLQPLGDQTLIDLTGPGPRSMDLSPGATWTLRPYVVLAGSTLTSIIELGSFLHHIPMVTVAGPQLRVHLTAEPPPRVAISPSPLQATLTSPVPVSSRFIWYGETRCDEGSGYAALTAGWTVGGDGRIHPDDPSGCIHFVWHAIAGWLGHPIATISYETGGTAELMAVHGHSGAPAVSATAHGIRFTLALGRSVFPRAALAPYTITIQNVSTHTINLWGPSALGDGLNYPEVDVLGRHGKVIFPPALHVPAIGPAMPNPFPYPVMPGQVIRRHGFVVLRGSSVRAQVPLDLDGTLPGYMVHTPVLHVALARPNRPRTRIEKLPEGVRIDPVGTVRGRLHFMDWAQCEYPPPASLTINGVYLWTAASTSVTALHQVGKGVRITPSCPALEPGGQAGSVVQWHVIAGWSNHTVATVDSSAT